MLKNYYVGSFDPPHLGHLNTYNKAKKALQEDIAIAICHNDIKGNRLMSLDESRIMCEITFTTNDVRVCENRDEMLSLIADSRRIIRGVGRKDDISDIYKIINYYHFENVEDKLLLIDIDESFMDISSSAIRQALAKDDLDGIVCSQLHPDVYRYLKKRKEAGLNTGRCDLC